MRMTKGRGTWLCCTVFAGFGLSGGAWAEEPRDEPSQPAAGDHRTAGQDPAQGEFASPAQRRAAAALLKKHREMVSTSARGLVQVKSPVAGGGVVVRLNGRFRNTMVARTDSGLLKTECGDGALLGDARVAPRAPRAEGDQE